MPAYVTTEIRARPGGGARREGGFHGDVSRYMFKTLPPFTLPIAHSLPCPITLAPVNNHSMVQVHVLIAIFILLEVDLPIASIPRVMELLPARAYIILAETVILTTPPPPCKTQ